MIWKELNNRLVFEVKFQTQTELAEFIMKVARIADEHNHHPDMMVRKCSELKLELYSHELNEITPKDHQIAELISLIPMPKKAKSVSSSWDL